MTPKIKSKQSNGRKLGFVSYDVLHRPSWFHVRPHFNAIGLAVFLFGALSFPVLGQSTNSSARPDYSAFKIVADRNIFNPHRYARSSRAREARPTSKADSFALVGTMSYEKGIFAFFDGSKSEFRKVVKPAETIAGYTVTDIAANSVKLASGSNQIELKVGNQMRREEDNEWQLGGAQDSSSNNRTASVGNRRNSERRTVQAEPPAETTNTESQAGDAPAQADIADVPADGTSTNASSSETDDPVLRRLMQRREQEINR